MSKFHKKVVQQQSGAVNVFVYDDNGKCVGREWFMSPFNSQETRLKKAHKWADKYIENCEKYVGEFK